MLNFNNVPRALGAIRLVDVQPAALRHEDKQMVAPRLSGAVADKELQVATEGRIPEVAHGAIVTIVLALLGSYKRHNALADVRVIRKGLQPLRECDPLLRKVAPADCRLFQTVFQRQAPVDLQRLKTLHVRVRIRQQSARGAPGEWIQSTDTLA